MHLPTPQFSRLVTVLAFDLSNPALDSMIMAWDHIASRYLKRLAYDRAAAGKIESVRLLAIHDAVHAVFGSEGGYIFTGASSASSLSAALAATAKASHDILVSVFAVPDDRADLGHALEESLFLISERREIAIGAAVGAESAATYLGMFSPLASESKSPEAGVVRSRDPQHDRSGNSPRQALRLAKNPNWRFEWQRSA